MFRPLKGSENISSYDTICKALCEANGWKGFSLISTAQLKFGKQETFKTLDLSDDSMVVYSV